MQEKVYTVIKANAKTLIIAVATGFAILALTSTSIKVSVESNDYRLLVEVGR